MSLLLLTIDKEQVRDEDLNSIKQNLPDGMTLVQSRDIAIIKSVSNEIEILAGWYDPAWLLEMPRLQWVQSWSAGVDWLMRYPELKNAPFRLTNSVGVHAVQISEHVFALILARGRNLPNAIIAQENEVWARVKNPTEPLDSPFSFSSGGLFELAKKRVLILGVGAIGGRVAKIAQGFDMHVIGFRRNPKKTSPHVDRMVGPDSLLDVLSEADFIVNILPLTDSTSHLLGPKEFAAMKANPFIVNVGRGPTIDQNALIDALRNGLVSGAGLDVFEEEPLADNSPLWTMPNVIITSHYAGATPHYHERALDILLDNLQRYQHNKPLRNIVDKQRGY